MFLKDRTKSTGSKDRRISRTKSRNLNYPADSHFSISHLAVGGGKKSVAMYPGICRDANLTRFITRFLAISAMKRHFLRFPFSNYGFLSSFSPSELGKYFRARFYSLDLSCKLIILRVRDLNLAKVSYWR